MPLEVSAAIAVFIFAVLAVFIIITLIRTNKLLKEIQSKSKNLDSFMHAISSLGDVCERQANQFRANTLSRPASNLDDQGSNYYPELATLLMLGLRLGDKFLRRK